MYFKFNNFAIAGAKIGTKKILSNKNCQIGIKHGIMELYAESYAEKWNRMRNRTRNFLPNQFKFLSRISRNVLATSLIEKKGLAVFAIFFSM